MEAMTVEGKQSAVRLLLIVLKSNPHWSQSCLSTEDILPIALEALRKNQLISPGRTDSPEGTEIPLRLLVKQQWHLRVLIVFDLFNKNYDVKLGHLPEHNNLPAFVVYFSGKGVSARAGDPAMRVRINKDTAYAHNVNGEHGVPPYVVDHTTTVPLYLNLRHPSLL